jgi:molybdopterin-guanine dinucleotide biosynthesis protein A
MPIHPEEITGLILAGGRATRMGGVDKGLQLLNGEPMVHHVLRRLQPQVGHMLINANRNAQEYRQFGVPVIADMVSGFAGPLAGLQAGLAQCTTGYLATAPCDSPLLPFDLVARLSGALEQTGSDVAVAATGTDGPPRGDAGTTSVAAAHWHPQRHPVFMLAKASLLPQLSDWLAAGGRKADDWLRSLRCAEVLFGDDGAFENVNTSAHLTDMSRRLR